MAGWRGCFAGPVLPVLIFLTDQPRRYAMLVTSPATLHQPAVDLILWIVPAVFAREQCK